jgi:hypothetical protein
LYVGRTPGNDGVSNIVKFFLNKHTLDEKMLLFKKHFREMRIRLKAERWIFGFNALINWLRPELRLAVFLGHRQMKQSGYAEKEKKESQN